MTLTREMASNEGVMAKPSILCFDTEDVEDWLVEEGIRHFDQSGMFHYGPAPYEGEDFDIASIDEIGPQQV